MGQKRCSLLKVGLEATSQRRKLLHSSKLLHWIHWIVVLCLLVLAPFAGHGVCHYCVMCVCVCVFVCGDTRTAEFLFSLRLLGKPPEMQFLFEEKTRKPAPHAAGYDPCIFEPKMQAPQAFGFDKDFGGRQKCFPRLKQHLLANWRRIPR